jgi:hypothetical protein
MMKGLSVQRLTRALCSSIATFQTRRARPPGRLAARTARLAKQSALWRRVACFVVECIPCFVPEGRCPRLRLRRTLHLLRFLCLRCCVSPKSRRTTGTTTLRRAYRSPNYKVSCSRIYSLAYHAQSPYSALEKSTGEEERQPEHDDNAQTIRPTSRSPRSAPAGVVSKSPPREIGPIVEDYSDLTTEEDDEWQEKFADFKMKTSVRRGLFHPDDIKTIGLAPPSPGPKTAPLPDIGVGRAPRQQSPGLPRVGVGVSVRGAPTTKCALALALAVAGGLVERLDWKV